MLIELDEGYSFGLGLFETILLYKGKLVFLDEHLARINKSIENLALNIDKLEKNEVFQYLNNNKNTLEYEVLKIVLSEKNRLFLKREYTYTKKDYEKGFSLNISEVRRNETSIFTFHKTLNYGDNILEKRKSKKLGYDEPIFLNSKNQITEGTTSNIFAVVGGKIYTPNLSCGLLNGIIRQYIVSNYDIIESEIDLEFLNNADEIFLTNSLFGIMPVNNLEKKVFKSQKISKEIFNSYKKYIKNI
ncbi:4-amino-4-deoxychorismate lyase [Fusobacterium polymorphum]|uniref:4-amino-4-deoxychorismate lyase n=1 Tax=Fusobacterium nucleatum subsp. polymorphum TaxID=76857 RepID=A0A2B7YGK9_FUSNP|nr:aminotransferase class IV [Fusobacterium polymorphum]PGH20022.1 4-amino-4-deoxychorismate lyase [Fusobacterium polymorphum]